MSKHLLLISVGQEGRAQLPGMEWRASVWDLDGGADTGSAAGPAARRLSSDWFVNGIGGGSCAHVDVTDLISGRALGLAAPSKFFELRVEGWTTGVPHATATVRGAAKFALEWDANAEAQVVSATNLPGTVALQLGATLSAETVTGLEKAAKEVAGQVERLQARMDQGLDESGRGRGDSILKTTSAYGIDGDGEVHRLTTSKVGRQR